MAISSENTSDGMVNILAIILLVCALVGLALTFLAFQASAVS